MKSKRNLGRIPTRRLAAVVLSLACACVSYAQLRLLGQGTQDMPDGRGIWEADAVAPAGEGCFYISGGVFDPRGPDSPYVLVKLSPTGRMLWAALPPKGESWGKVGFNGMAVCPDGGAVTTGTGMGLLVTKHSSTGTLAWASHIRDGGNGRVVAVGKSGDIYAAGERSNGLGYARHTFTLVKLSPQGKLLWRREYSSGRPHHRGHPTSIGVDAEGNVILVTTYATGNAVYDLEVYKHTSRGELLWVSRYVNGDVHPGLTKNAIRYGADGSVYVHATIIEPEISGGYLGSVALLKFSADGHLDWEARPPELQVSSGGIYSPTHITLDEANGRVYALATSFSERPMSSRLTMYDMVTGERI